MLTTSCTDNYLTEAIVGGNSWDMLPPIYFESACSCILHLQKNLLQSNEQNWQTAKTEEAGSHCHGRAKRDKWMKSNPNRQNTLSYSSISWVTREGYFRVVFCPLCFVDIGFTPSLFGVVCVNMIMIAIKSLFFFFKYIFIFFPDLIKTQHLEMKW